MRSQATWCAKCKAEVFWIPAAALGLAGTSYLSASEIHTNSGRVCSLSLFEHLKTIPSRPTGDQ